jgi:hypothetical protein
MTVFNDYLNLCNGQLMSHKPKTVFDEYKQFIELVPGVFLDNQDPNATAVYIVDRNGEICMWNSDEVAEDPEAFIAAITAVALAAKYQAGFVRTNLENKGRCVEDMIAETGRTVANMLPLPDYDDKQTVGYTKPLVNEILDDRDIPREKFWKWMNGQSHRIQGSMGLTDAGEHVVYCSDFVNFLRGGPITD